MPHPHVPAAFINAIAEEGTKAEAIEWLQKQWNETCALRAAMRLVSQRLHGLSTVTHSNGAVKECAEYLDGKLSEDNSAALQTFGTLEK